MVGDFQTSPSYPDFNVFLTYCNIEGVGEDLKCQDQVDCHELEDSTVTCVTLFSGSQYDEESPINAKFDLF